MLAPRQHSRDGSNRQQQPYRHNDINGAIYQPNAGYTEKYGERMSPEATIGRDHSPLSRRIPTYQDFACGAFDVDCIAIRYARRQNRTADERSQERHADGSGNQTAHI
jgi:hypothetical protein